MKKKLKLDADPKVTFLKWYQEALKTDSKHPDAMVLATVQKGGAPNARVVLYKGMDSKGFRFFTNYQGQKGKELQSNPKAVIVFYWPELERQVRVAGQVKVLSAADSDDYWRSRPRASQLSATVSPQSRIILDRKTLEQKKRELDQKFKGQEIPRPHFWGGFTLIPKRIEFWVEGQGRFHERYCYVKRSNQWKLSTLAP